MLKLSVIIPYYQTRRGILRRAIESVLAQEAVPGWVVDVIIVDDGSPVPAALEFDELEIPDAYKLITVTQENGGVSRARNAGLDIVDPQSQYIAFLDSDDIWGRYHLQHSIQALGDGFDFYFCDHGRRGRYVSHIKDYCPRLCRPEDGAVIELSKEELIDEILDSFPTNSSTVVYRRSVAPSLRFNSGIRSAGEDILFYTQLVSICDRVCCDLRRDVECADGINMFFSHYDQWDSPARLSIAVDRVVVHELLEKFDQLSRASRIRVKYLARAYRTDLVFFALRQLKRQRQWPSELFDFGASRPFFSFWFVGTAVKVLILRAFKLYEPL